MEVNLIDQWLLVRDIAGVSRWRFEGVEFSDEEIAFIQKAKSDFMKSQELINARLIQLGRIPNEDLSDDKKAPPLCHVEKVMVCILP